jgi:hypothetical protein
MRYAFGLIAALPLLASAQNTPTILATIPNNDGGKITFTSVKGQCPEDQSMVYTQGKNGKVSLTGCYRLIDSEMFVLWADGDVYTYPFASLTFSQEMIDYAQKSK